MTPRRIDVTERRSRLALRHRHVPGARTDDVVAITDGLVALHSTDPVTVYLSVAARMRTPALEPLATALYDDRTLIRHHAMRRTLWVFGHEAARLAHHGATLAVARVQRRDLLASLGASGVADPEAWLAHADAQVHAGVVQYRIASLRREPAVRRHRRAYEAFRGDPPRCLSGGDESLTEVSVR